MQVQEYSFERKIRLTSLALDILRAKYQLALLNPNRHIVYTEFPTQHAKSVVNMLKLKGLEASIHKSAYKYNTVEIVIQLDDLRTPVDF